MPRQQTLILSAATITVFFLLSSCGQSGPLYIPGDPSRITVPPSEGNGEDEESDESDASTTDQP